jgi:hypothetical protein
MLSIAGYTVAKRVRTGAGVDVYVGTRDSDRMPVSVTVHLGDDAEAVGRARGEYDALRAAQGPGVPRALDLRVDQAPPAVLLDQTPGLALASFVAASALAPRTFLEIAIQLTQIVERIHDAQLMHCGITPHSVRVDAVTLRTYLGDFWQARVLGAAQRAAESMVRRSSLASSLCYVAPEQTGRMARGIDARSDLYGLGATLYFALTGRPPFESDDALALVHAHMARMPDPPVELRPDLPATLSRIVVKLLQKEPSDRYQTAKALTRDLEECRSQLERRGSIADELPLGTADAPVRPLFAMRLYGRAAEIATLCGAYDRVARGAVELVILSGAPGAGKSVLVHELRTCLAETTGYLATGKFDLYRRDVPYSGLVSALGSLVHQILIESEERLAHWRETLRAALGSLARVVVDLVPDIGLILGDVPPVPHLPPRETQARLSYALRRLMEGCARREHPVVLFLDDLQWADPGSRGVLESLLTDARDAALLVLATCRDEHEPAWRPVAALVRTLEARDVAVTQIPVPPLGIPATTEMLADALDQPTARVAGLADCVALKTGCNPLWIQQFVLHVHQLGLIRFEHPAGFTWDEAGIAAAAVPEGAVGLLVAKLERLEQRPRDVLQLASCVGDVFEVELLAELSGEPREALEIPLFALAREGLIAPSQQGFRFVHDRIREAAQALLEAGQRTKLHARTARHLLEQAPLAAFTDRVFEIADHLNRGLDHLSDEERFKAIEINASAGARALAAGASQTADSYLSVARDLVREEHWDRNPTLLFNLLFQSAEAAQQTSRPEHAIELLDALEARPLAMLQRAQVAARRLASLAMIRPEEALDRTLVELRRFGVRLPRRPSWLRVRLTVAYTDWKLRGPLGPSAFGRSPTADPAWVAPILIVGGGGPALVRGGSMRLLTLATTRTLLRFQRYGALPGMALSMAAYTAQRIATRGDLVGAERYVRGTEELMEAIPSPMDVRARFNQYCFTLPYLRSRRSLLEPLRRIAENALELGDPEYAAYTATHRWHSLALCGEPVDLVRTELAEFASRAQSPIIDQMNTALGAIYSVLADLRATERDWSQEPAVLTAARRHAVEGDGSLTFHWFLVLCYFSEFERAKAISASLDPVKFSTNPTASVDLLMFRSICHGAVAQGGTRRGRRALARDLTRMVQRAAPCVGSGSDFAHMLHVVRAECARLQDRSSEALKLYQQGAQLAMNRGYRHHVALIFERRASLLLASGRVHEAREALRHAAERYAQWGASGKLKQLERALHDAPGR